ncbi:MAG TPA: PASTA domain-containing protein [Chloroflexota bacterium]|jgi:peptide/nickel transport system substrate-binding protein
MKSLLRGRYRDRVLEPDGRVVEGDWRPNLIVVRALDLLAGLLTGQAGLRGILYWAVGTGDPTWGDAPPAPQDGATRLVDELYRRPLDPARQIEYDPLTRTLRLRVAFGPAEAVGVLREFGLFGGDASGARDSGFLINYRTHAPIDKTRPRVLERTLELTLGPAPDVVVPSLTGLDLAAARAQLDAAGLALGEARRSESEQPGDTVLSQEPAAGARVAPGIAVALTLATAPTGVVPNLVGLGAAAAKARVEAASLRLADGPPATLESDAPSNTVVAQAPTAGARAVQGAAVAITLALPRTVLVPSVVGRALAEARSLLAAAGLSPLEDAPEEGDLPTGTVVAQDPAAGARALRNATVLVTASSGPHVTVPDLTGLTPRDAGQALAQAGLNLGAVGEGVSPRALGTVFQQQPAAGARAPLGSTVDALTARPDMVATPDLVGRTPAQAGPLLSAAGLALAPDPPRRASVATPNTIIEQRPAAGEPASRGDEVHVVVAAPVMVAVPSLVGGSLALARELLGSVGLSVAEPPGEQETPDAAPGTVLAQAVAAGTSIAAGTAVGLTVAAPVRVAVPNLVGQTFAAAAATLQGVGLSLSPTDPGQRESDAPSGTVVEQQPAAAQRVLPGTAVAVVVAVPRTALVPNLVGQSAAAARSALSALGLTLADGGGQESDQPAGTVVSQAPAAGTRVTVGSAVTLVLAVPRTVLVPGVVGRPLAEARDVVRTAGLAPVDGTPREGTEPPGTIVAQNPAGGARVTLGSNVTLTAATPRTALVPALVGQTVAAARAALAQLGLTLTAGGQEESDQPAGTVVRQTPAAGTRALVGSEVVVVAAVPRTALVPSLTGQPLADARAALTSVGLSPLEATPREGDEPPGTVVAQDPAAGTRVTLGSAVTITAATPRTAVVPSLVGQALEAARAALTALGLTLAVGGEQEGTQPPGTVVSQVPAPGARVPLGSPVTVVLARAPSRPPGTLIAALGQEPDRLYVHGTSMLAAGHVLQGLYDGPFDQRGFAYQPVILEGPPALTTRVVSVAAGAPIAQGGRVGRALAAMQLPQVRALFRLRAGLRWEDGTPVTSADVVFAFNAVRDRGTPCSKLRAIRTASYRGLDDQTVEWLGLPGWTDAAPIFNFWTPLPSRQLGGVAPAELFRGAFSQRPIGYGPFRLTEWRPGEAILLERHPAYFRASEGLPRLDRLVLSIVGDGDAVLQRLIAGDVDAALVGSLGLEQLPRLMNESAAGRLRVQAVPGNAIEYLLFGIAGGTSRTAFFDDARVRQAVAAGIDRDRLIRDLLAGAADSADSFVPAKHPVHTRDLPQHPFDPPTAARLLADAGWQRGATGVLARGGQEFHVSMLVPTGRTDRLKAADLIQANLGDLGIRVDVVPTPPAKLFARGPDGPLFGRQFDLALVGWVAGVEPPAELFLCEEISGDANAFGGPNLTGWCDAKFDAAALAAMSATDPAVRQRQWDDAQRVFASELPALPLYQPFKLAASRPGLVGFEVDVSQPSELWDVEDLTLG